MIFVAGNILKIKNYIQVGTQKENALKYKVVHPSKLSKHKICF